jgi:Tol biopolymer transport system component
MSIAVGALIGCALLSVVAIILLIIANAFMNNSEAEGSSATSTSRAIAITASAQAIQGGFLGINPEQNTSGTPDLQPSETVESDDSAESSATTTPAPLGVRSWLADGGILYFAERDAENGRNFEIFRRNLRNDDEVQLTADLHSNQYPSMSPDGLRIVFQSDRSGGDYDLYTISRSGGTPTTLTTNTLDDLYPVWSPDGEWIAFVSDTQGDDAYDLMRVRPDGSGLENLLYTDERISHPSWNADGTRLIYVIGEPQDARTWDIGVYDFATRTTWKLTDDNTRDAWPIFHPDGQSILFVSSNDGEAQINHLNLDSEGMAAGLPEVVYDESEYVWGLSYTPDGQYITFNAGGIEDGPGEVYVISADDGGRTRRVLTTSGGAYITWIP